MAFSELMKTPPRRRSPRLSDRRRVCSTLTSNLLAHLMLTKPKRARLSRNWSMHTRCFRTPQSEEIMTFPGQILLGLEASNRGHGSGSGSSSSAHRAPREPGRNPLPKEGRALEGRGEPPEARGGDT